MKNSLQIIFGILVFATCSAQKNGQGKYIKDFYFPYQDFVNKRTYLYVNVNDTTDRETWIMQTKIQNGDTLFYTRRYDSKNRITESLAEKITGTAALMIELNDWYYDYNDSAIVRENIIVDSVIFRWSQKLNDSVFWKVNYKSLHTSKILELSKSRTLIKIDSENGIAIFKDKYDEGLAPFSVDSNHTWILQNRQKSTSEWSYQKGKGLVRFRVVAPKKYESNWDYQLVTIR